MFIDLFYFFMQLPTQLYMAVVRTLAEEWWVIVPRMLPFYWCIDMQLYTFVTVSLGSQSIYYGYIYPQSQYKRQLKVQIRIPMLRWDLFIKLKLCNTVFSSVFCHCMNEQVETPTKAGPVEKVSDAEQSHEVDDFSLSSPIPLPARLPSISTGRDLFYQYYTFLFKSVQNLVSGLKYIYLQSCRTT